jgi:acetaldehyde dehydrogenase/alcohol dehydrogenase
MVQIDSGFDALSHAIPAYYSNFGNDFSQALALQALRLVMKYLAPAAQGDKQAKEHMHYAACQAGMAFTNTNALLNVA